MIEPTPIRNLRLGQRVVLEEAGLVKITGLYYFAEYVEIEYDGSTSPIPRHLARPAHGIWSGLYTDFPFITVYHQENHNG